MGKGFPRDAIAFVGDSEGLSVDRLEAAICAVEGPELDEAGLGNRRLERDRQSRKFSSLSFAGEH